MLCSSCKVPIPEHKHLVGCPKNPEGIDATNLVKQSRDALIEIKNIKDTRFRRHCYGHWAQDWAEILINKLEQLNSTTGGI